MRFFFLLIVFFWASAVSAQSVDEQIRECVEEPDGRACDHLSDDGPPYAAGFAHIISGRHLAAEGKVEWAMDHYKLARELLLPITFPPKVPEGLTIDLLPELGGHQSLREAVISGRILTELHVQIGDILLKEGRELLAIDEYNWALQFTPNTASAFAGRGEANRQLEEHESALKDLDRAIELAPANGDYYITRGYVRESTDDLSGAIADFTKSIELGNDSADIHFDRAVAYIWSDDQDRALSDLTEAIRKNPFMDDAYTVRGEILQNLGEIEKAKKDFVDAVRIATNKVYNFIRLAMFLEATGEPKTLTKDFYALLYTAKRDVYLNLDHLSREDRVYLGHGIFLLEETIKERTESSETLPFLHSILAIAYLAAGDPKDALRHYTEATRFSETAMKKMQQQLYGYSLYDAPIDGTWNRETGTALGKCVEENCQLITQN